MRLKRFRKSRDAMGAPNQWQLYSKKLESLLEMPPAEPGEDLNARRDELNRRLSPVRDPETIARAQIILGRLGPIEEQLRAEADAKAEAQAAVEQRRAQNEAPKTVSITQSVSIPFTHGAVEVPAGTRLEVVSRDGSEVRIRYAGAEYVIPVSVTDLK